MRTTAALSLLAIAALAGCSSTAPDRAAEARPTVQSVEARLQTLQDAGVRPDNYTMAKARCWSRIAFTQDAENDRTGFVADALREADRLAAALEADRATTAGDTTPDIAGATRIRPDLWARIAQAKAQPGTLACTAQTLACAEVRLVRAAHANSQTGWRGARTHIEMVDDALERARRQAASCGAPAQR